MSTRSLFLLALGMSLVAYSSPSFAKRVTPEKNAEAAMVEKYLRPVDQACGTGIDVDLDWASFKGDPLKQWEQYGVEKYCGEPLRQLKLACQDAVGKKAVQAAHITKYVCAWAGKDKPSALTLGSGRLDYRVNFEQDKHYVFVQGAIEPALKYKFASPVKDPYYEQ